MNDQKQTQKLIPISLNRSLTVTYECALMDKSSNGKLLDSASFYIRELTVKNMFTRDIWGTISWRDMEYRAANLNPDEYDEFYETIKKKNSDNSILHSTVASDHIRPMGTKICQIKTQFSGEIFFPCDFTELKKAFIVATTREGSLVDVNVSEDYKSSEIRVLRASDIDKEKPNTALTM